MSLYAIKEYRNEVEKIIHFVHQKNDHHAEKFNTYKFSDYKDKVIELLKRVCTVSLETMKIINPMPQL